MNLKVTIPGNLIRPSGSSTEFVGTASAAREKLTQMAVSMVTESGVRSGYLRLTDSKDGVTLGTNVFRRTRSTDTARDLVRSMVRTAYGNHAEVEGAIVNYLAESNQRLGTQSFVKLIQNLESKYGPADSQGSVPPQVGSALHAARPSASARLETGNFQLTDDFQGVDRAAPQVQSLLQQQVGQSPVEGSGANVQSQAEEHPQLSLDENPGSPGLLGSKALPEFPSAVLQWA
jgi:hypothetical protein